MKFRKKPIVIDAVQFTLIGQEMKYLPDGVYQDKNSSTGYSIDTLEGKHEVTPGDFIITGVKGEKYPCKPDIFEMTYEPVETQHKADCKWINSLCEYKETHNYCPHPEHACNCFDF